MGICFSCLRSGDSDDMERSHLLGSDDPFNPSGGGGYAYGGTTQSLASRHLNPEEAKREQEALENITRWTTDTVVDIFPSTALLQHHQHHQPANNPESDAAMPLPSSSNVRVYPASRPESQASRQASIRSKASSRLEGSGSTRAPRIFRTLEIGEGD